MSYGSLHTQTQPDVEDGYVEDGYLQSYHIPPVPSLYERYPDTIYELEAMRTTISPIILLGKIFQTLKLPLPLYTDYKTKHERYFCVVSLGGKIAFRSLEYAVMSHFPRRDAARKALDFVFRCPSAFYVEEDARMYTMPPLIIPEIHHGSYILALRELCQANGFEAPIYVYDEPSPGGGWGCRISIKTGGGVHNIGYGRLFPCKRRAKTDAAKAAYEGLAGIGS